MPIGAAERRKTDSPEETQHKGWYMHVAVRRKGTESGIAGSITVAPLPKGEKLA